MKSSDNKYLVYLDRIVVVIGVIAICSIALTYLLDKVGVVTAPWSEETTINKHEVRVIEKEKEQVNSSTLVNGEYPEDETNYGNMVAQITNYEQSTGNYLKRPGVDPSENLTGSYFYVAKTTSVSDLVTLEVEGNGIELRSSILEVYDNENEATTPLMPYDTGILVVHYINHIPTSARFIRLNVSYAQLLDDVAYLTEYQEDIPVGNISMNTIQDFSKVKPSEWKMLAEEASTSIEAKGMKPIFFVPIADIKADSELTGTFYYIIVGNLDAKGTEVTTLGTFQGKRITLDFPVEVEEEALGHPVWIHVVVQDGVVVSTQVQPLIDADLIAVSEGIVEYIHNLPNSTN